MTTKLHIELKDGKWLVNGSPYAAMTLTEREFFHRFLDEVRPYSAIAEIKRAVSSFVKMIDINDPVFDKPISELETSY